MLLIHDTVSQAEASMAKLDEILKSILEEKGVQEYIILNSDGKND